MLFSKALFKIIAGLAVVVSLPFDPIEPTNDTQARLLSPTSNDSTRSPWTTLPLQARQELFTETYTTTVTFKHNGTTTLTFTTTTAYSVSSSTSTPISTISQTTETLPPASTTYSQSFSTPSISASEPPPGNTPTSTGNPSTGSGPGDHMSTGMKAGIGVGCGVVGAFFLGVVLWWCMPARRPSQPEQAQRPMVESRLADGSDSSRDGGSNAFSSSLASPSGTRPRDISPARS